MVKKDFPMTVSPPGWKILIRQLPSDHLFYCNFLRRIRFRSSLAHRKTPWGVKSAFLGQKPHFQGWKNQFFAIFHPGDIPDPQFDPGIGFYAQNYMGNKSYFKFLLLKIFLKSQKWHQNSNLWIPFQIGSNSSTFGLPHFATPRYQMGFFKMGFCRES